MYKKFLLLIVLASSLVVSQIVLADSSICRPGLNKMVQSINLDDSQKVKIKPILDQLKSNLKSAGSQMGGLEEEITQQANSATMDQSKVNNLIDKQAKLIGDMMKAKIIAKNQIFSILNPQQKEKLQGMIKKSDEKMAAEFKNCDQD